MTEVNITPFKHSRSEIIERIQTIQSKYAISAISQHLDACANLLTNQNTIDVGIFGRFKAGKSSLLNLISSRPVLPVGVTPITTVVTRLRYGSRERAEICYTNGRVENIPIESVKSFVSEAENPKNVKKVLSVTIELPSLKAYQGLQFVDTPGLESIFQHNTDTALDWLPKVGLALVTISVDPPLSKNDVELIRILRSYTPRIVILLTKADLISEVEREEIAAFIKSELLKEFSTEFQTVLFSVRPSYEHFKTALDKDLLLPLVESRDSTRSEIVRFKFHSLLDHTKDYLSLALSAAKRVDTDRAKLKAQILNEKTSLESIRMELQALATECAGQTRPWIVKRTKELRHELQQRLTQELRERLSKIKGNLYNLSRSYEQWLRETMKREMMEISMRDGDLFIVPLEKARDSLSRAIQGFRDRLTGNIEQALGMRFQVEPFEIDLQKPSSPDVAISKLFMFNTDLLWFVIPMSIFRSWANRHFLKQIPWETEKNLSRLASQWTEKINASIIRMQGDAERFVRDQLSTVESLLSRTQSEAEEIMTSISEVESFRCTISS
jgi:GTP-binding protein EngB required for normal cell division